MEQLLFIGGIILSGFALIAALIAALFLRAGKRRLDKCLDTEYGSKKR